MHGFASYGFVRWNRPAGRLTRVRGANRDVIAHKIAIGDHCIDGYGPIRKSCGRGLDTLDKAVASGPDSPARGMIDVINREDLLGNFKLSAVDDVLKEASDNCLILFEAHNPPTREPTLSAS